MERSHHVLSTASTLETSVKTLFRNNLMPFRLCSLLVPVLLIISSPSFFCLAQSDVHRALLTEVFGLNLVGLDEESFLI